jgi:Rrf2 family transcriptional regulator, iron-sulfur cluster assembly transcription factor
MITKKAEYAINILAELARREKERFYPSGEVAARHGTPPNLVPQIVSRLQKEGLVQSARGPTGGIQLSMDPEDISLKMVIELFDGPIGLTRCLAQEDYCNKTEYCPLHSIWKRTQGRMLSELEETSIKDLAEEYAHVNATS